MDEGQRLRDLEKEKPKGEGSPGKKKPRGEKDPGKRALEAAGRYLSERDRSCREVREFLEKKGFSSLVREQVMEALTGQGLVNDLRYARLRMTEEAEKGRSLSGIRRLLEEKGISREDIDLAFELTWDLPSEEQRAMTEAEKLISQEGPGVKTLRKIAARLSYRGYQQELIYEILEKLADAYGIYDFSS